MIINLRVSIPPEDEQRFKDFVGKETPGELAQWLADLYFWDNYEYINEGADVDLLVEPY